MTAPYITGIQQVGLGVTDVAQAWQWYRRVLGFDVPVFDDYSEARLMTQYTGEQVHSRRALMALNMAGGGGLEIWQFTSRAPQSCTFQPQPGDLGIYAIRFKAPDAKSAHEWVRQQPQAQVSAFGSLPEGEGFWGKDPFGNIFQVAEDSSWFHKNGQPTGGVAGVVIGVSDIEPSVQFYKALLEPCELVYDQTGTFDDMPASVADQRFRRVLLRKGVSKQGAFSQLLGNVQVELIQALDRQPQRLFTNRYWGDCGYIHVCFDTLNMDSLKKMLTGKGYPFTVDSENSFGMETAAGRFAYVEDPDGTLIELVETHKLPILKKVGWYLDLQKRKHQKPLPNWMLRMMSLSRVRD
ncbi:VOC family protein [Telluribacter sp.]|jgi:catechol 2,3-dioxygenase-like lactoylglutathione lyase family enzyme|uniref:VOC family protein n=1 Tax=Telluribacter sp. TaxID=1978767 RepID=UPI002E0E208F|nr:VOC family protein [Telluribacter sp.]